MAWYPRSSEQQVTTAESIDLMFIDDNHAIAACVVPSLKWHFELLESRIGFWKERLFPNPSLIRKTY